MSKYTKASLDAARNALNHESLKRRLHYNPETGVFTWLETHVHRLGKEAGSVKAGEVSKDGRRYRYINISGVPYRANRLAWFYMTGKWPDGDVDHENLIRDDNRWSNLRDATRAQNNVNSALPTHNKSGFKGVSFDKANKKWVAQMSVENRTVKIGRFATPELAAEAYRAAIVARFGEFARFE